MDKIIFKSDGEIIEAYLIPEWEGYSITDCGQVYTHKKTRPMNSLQNRIVTIDYSKGKKKKTQTNQNGYLTISLSDKGKLRTEPIHRIIAKLFHGEKPNGMEIRHLDGNQLNCYYKNLKYGTPKENYEDRIKHGTNFKGEYSPTAKLTQRQADAIREIRKLGMNVKELSKWFKVGISSIECILSNKSYESSEGKITLKTPRYPLIIIDSDNKEYFFSSALEASKRMGIPYERIMSIIKGLKKANDGRQYYLCDKKGNKI